MKNNLSDHWNLVSSIRVDHPAYALAITELGRAIRSAGTSVTPVCLLLLGESGTGKSSVIKDVCEEFASQRTETGLKATVLRAKAPSDGTCKGMAEMLLHALGDEHWSRGTLSGMTSRLYRLLHGVGCKAIIIDEFQHLTDKGQGGTLHRASDWLKVLVEDQPWALLAAGLPNCKRVVNQNEQLARRFDSPILLPRFDWNIAADQADWRRLLAAFQVELDPFELPDLQNEEMSFRTYLATSGRIGLLAKLLERAVRDAIEAGRTKIHSQQLQAAYSKAVWTEAGFPVRGGPFGGSFDELCGYKFETNSPADSSDAQQDEESCLVTRGSSTRSGVATNSNRELEKAFGC